MIFPFIFIAALAVFGVLPVVSLVLARAWWRKGERRRALAASAMCALLGLIGLDAFVLEPHDLEVTHHVIPAPGLEQALTIAVLADIQTDSPGPHERRAFDQVREQAPDLVLFPGDFVQVGGPAYTRQAERLRQLLREADIRPRLGAYAVDGNVEVTHDDWPRIFEGTGIEAWTARQRLDLGPVVLTGLPLRESFDESLELPREDAFHIVFGHAPDFSLSSGVHADLMLAGHTHGGQVRLPFIGALITFSQVPRDQAAGWTRLPKGRNLVVSRGIGMERGSAPRMRFNCRPELVFVKLVPTGD